jgi:DNA-binding XRE family transcriptional regulator
MPRGKKYTTEQIIPKLREAELLMSQGTTQELAAKQIGVSAQTLIRWRKEFGGLAGGRAVRALD